jgi:N-acetylmuramic acid 6-phosphate etherase
MDLARDLGALLTEQINPASTGLDALPTVEMLAVFHRSTLDVQAAVEAELPRIAAAVDAIAERLAHGGRLFYTGAGTSGRLGVLDASECPPTFNVAPTLVTGIIAGGDGALRTSVEGAEDSPELGAKELFAHGFTGEDVLIGIAASGRTPYVLGAIDRANELGALTGCLVCSPGSPIAARVRLPIEVLAGPEVITGSTRLKAGTATKLVLNMLSSGVLIRLGCVYGNLMVNVQPTNAKLVDRAERILMTLAGVSREQASALLTASGSNVRTAIVMARRGLDRADAERHLAGCGNRLREALLRPVSGG